LGPCHRGVVAPDQRAWHAAVSALRQFVARALLKWMADHKIEIALIDPGKPWQNGVGESLHGKFRDACLASAWFLPRAQAKVGMRAAVGPPNRGSPASEPRLFDAGSIRRKAQRAAPAS